MKIYCTIEDVLSVARVFIHDVKPEIVSDATSYRQNAEVISREEVTDIIYEASEMVRKKLRPRYNTAVIDAYDPNFPRDIVYLTKTYAAMLMYERYAPASMDRNKIFIDMLKRSMASYENTITTGSLVDTDDVPVPTVVNPKAYLGEDNTDYPAASRMKRLYEYAKRDGRIY